MTNNAFSAGYSEAVITPPLGLNIPGYYGDRLATGKINDLMLRAVALQSGTTKAVLFSCDCISIRNAGYYLLRKKIAERCQIPEETVYIACNHSHTSFRICAPDQAYSEDFATYLSRLVQIFCDCAQFAFQDLKPAALRIGKGEAKGVGFIRRCIMKDGTLKTNPPIGSPEIDRYASEHDDSLQLIRIDRESAKNILLINFGTHSDTIGGNLYCSDYSGYLIENLKGAFGGNIEAVFFNGAEGDSNHRNVFLPKDAPMKGIPVAKRMARILAGEVLKIYDDATEAKSGEIRASVQVLPIQKNLYEPKDVPTAEEMYRIYLEKGKSAPELKKYPLILSFCLHLLPLLTFESNESRNAEYKQLNLEIKLFLTFSRVK